LFGSSLAAQWSYPIIRSLSEQEGLTATEYGYDSELLLASGVGLLHFGASHSLDRGFDFPLEVDARRLRHH
ncbi:592_t:CDS:2, partial [Gigaspora rosea]